VIRLASPPNPVSTPHPRPLSHCVGEGRELNPLRLRRGQGEGEGEGRCQPAPSPAHFDLSAAQVRPLSLNPRLHRRRGVLYLPRHAVERVGGEGRADISPHPHLTLPSPASGRGFSSLPSPTQWRGVGVRGRDRDSGRGPALITAGCATSTPLTSPIWARVRSVTAASGTWTVNCMRRLAALGQGIDASTLSFSRARLPRYRAADQADLAPARDLGRIASPRKPQSIDHALRAAPRQGTRVGAGRTVHRYPAPARDESGDFIRRNRRQHCARLVNNESTPTTSTLPWPAWIALVASPAEAARPLAARRPGQGLLDAASPSSSREIASKFRRPRRTQTPPAGPGPIAGAPALQFAPEHLPPRATDCSCRWR